MNRLRLILALSSCSLLAAPALAGAHPGQRGFAVTFPHAARLCAKVTNGHAPKPLQGSSAQVAAACATLKTSFTNAQNSYATKVAPLQQQATAAVNARRLACQGRPVNKVSCRQARQNARTTLKGIRVQVRAATQGYHVSVQAARKAFWDTIRTLRGGATEKPDVTVGPDPVTVLPAA